jgi:hypothetical protein
LIVSPRSRGAVEEHLHAVVGSREVHGRTGAVVDLQRFVVTGALDVLGDEELGRSTLSVLGPEQKNERADHQREPTQPNEH